jgi:hypothetical protein
VVLFFVLPFLREKDERCGRCGNLAFVARFPNPCGRVLCVHRGGGVHIVFDLAKMFNRVIAFVMLERTLEKIALGAS